MHHKQQQQQQVRQVQQWVQVQQRQGVRRKGQRWCTAAGTY
jgi:hypothetical protein